MMTFWSRSIAGIAIASAMGVGAAAAQDAASFPADEAGLYAAAKQEGSVVWYTASAQDLSQAMADAFEKVYPGVHVDVLRVASAQQYQRFLQETEAGQNIADVVNLADRPMMQSLVDEGDIAAWKLPTQDRFAEQYRIGDYATSFALTKIIVLYNENKVSPEEAELLKSWDGILDPRFKGRVATVTGKAGVVAAGLQVVTDPALVGADFAARFSAQEPVRYNDVLGPVDRVNVGEQDVYFWAWEAIGVSTRAKGAPLRWAYPNPTPIYGNNLYGVSAHAPHPNAARLLLNWFGSEAGSIAMQQAFGAAPSMSGVEDVRPVTKEDWFAPEAAVFNVDLDRWENNYTADIDAWDKALQR